MDGVTLVSDGVTITWLGQSGFHLSANGVTVVVDAFLSPWEGRLYDPPITPDQLGNVDVVLCTHEHIDHLDLPTVRALAQRLPSAVVVLPAPVVPMALEAGIPERQVLGAQPGTDPLPGLPVPVYAVPARHGVEVADAYTFGTELSDGQVRYLGYVVELGGARVYHAGDTITWPEHAELLRNLGVHVALLPINGRDPVRERQNLVGNLDHREAALLAAEAGVDTLIPMHWDTFEHNQGFPDHLISVVTRLSLPLHVLVPRRLQPFRYLPPTGEPFSAAAV